jgi:hypothetical protein
MLSRGPKSWTLDPASQLHVSEERNSELHSRESPKPRSAVKCVHCTLGYFFSCFTRALCYRSLARISQIQETVLRHEGGFIETAE